MLDIQETPQASVPINRFYLRHLRENVVPMTQEGLAEKHIEIGQALRIIPAHPKHDPREGTTDSGDVRFLFFLDIFYFFCLIVFVKKYFDTLSFSSSPDSHKETLKKIKRAVDLAVRCMVFNSDCIYYSLAFAMMLRRRTIPAVVCMGVSSFLFRAHAWVEVNGVVVSGDEELVADITGQTIREFIQKVVKTEDAELITDQYQGYNAIGKQMKHETINRSEKWGR